MYRVLARKYRPQIFSDLVGQEVLVRTLSNAFATGRIAHAFLLTGIRGIGKTTTARIIARGLNCVGADGANGPTITPCGVCANCTMIAESRHMDVLEMDAASNTGVDNMRELIGSVQYAPSSARYKVYIIDEVHMLSTGAFNALLKTLEEPPPHVKFIFATTEIRKIPVTILSRCQKFELKRVETESLAQHLEKILGLENVHYESEGLRLIAGAAEGSVRDSLSLLDQAIAHNAEADGIIRTASVRDMLGMNDKSQIFSLLDHLAGGQIAEVLREFRKLHADGADVMMLLQDIMAFVHFMSRLKITPQAANDVAFSQAERDFALALSAKLSIGALTGFWQMLLKGLQETRIAPDPAAACEMTLIRIAYSADLPSPVDLIRSLHKNETASGPRPFGTMGAGAPGRGPIALITTHQAAPAPLVAAQPQAGFSPGSFAEAVELFRARREPVLYNYLMRHVRLVAFETGRLELNVDASVPVDFAGKVAKSLTDWTGARWMVILSKSEGGDPLQVLRDKASASACDAITAHPLVAAVLEQFKGAKVTKITGVYE